MTFKIFLIQAQKQSVAKLRQAVFVEIKKNISRIKVIKATICFQKKFKKSLDTGEIPCYTLISYAGN